MTVVEYPWRWLAEAVGDSFGLRYPWVEAARRAAARAGAACVLFPEAAGRIDGWVDWLAGLVDPASPVACLVLPGDFAELTRSLAGSFQLDEALEGGRPADWARRFLAEVRRHLPHCDPYPLLVADPDADCCSGVLELVEAQRALGYQLTRPVLVRRAPPPGWSGEVVRFGLPELIGDLYRIAPPPERDLTFWTNLVLALTVAWEAGAAPQLADELWDEFRLGRPLSLRETGFDEAVDRQLNAFAARHAPARNGALPEKLAYGPLPAVDDGLWQAGAVACSDGVFDVTPLQARVWAKELAREDAREALRRRRIENIPLARWLSAWATSIEESLRVAALSLGAARFRRFLEGQRPRKSGSRNRWEELAVTGEIAGIDEADFGDLAGFVGSAAPRNGRHANLPKLLDLCRLARNRVVHERRLAADDILKIAAVVDWLSGSGLL